MAWPSDLTRTKDWGNEVLTDSDLEGQFDLIINWLMATMNATTGHDHSATANKSQKVNLSGGSIGVTGTLGATLGGTGIATYTQGDILYSSAANVLSKLGAGTLGYLLRTGGAGANPSFVKATQNFKIGTFTRDLTAASGTVSISIAGLDVAPAIIFIFGAKTASSNMSIGISNGSSNYSLAFVDAGTTWSVNSAGTTVQAGTGVDNQQGLTQNFSTSGFDIVWTKNGSPAGTFTGFYLVLG